MNTVIDMMLAIRKNNYIFYHKDTNEFDYCPVSRKELERLSPNERRPKKDLNNYRLPSYEEIDHKDIMRFFVQEFVADKEIRTTLFNILRRVEFMDAYLDKLRELDLYQDFLDACGAVYIQIFDEWAEKNGLDDYCSGFQSE